MYVILGHLPDQGRTVVLGVTETEEEIESLAVGLTGPGGPWLMVEYQGPFEPGRLAIP